MLMPIGQTFSQPVTVIRAMPSPVIRAATVFWYDGAAFKLRAGEDEDSLRPGDTVVMDFGSQGPSRCRARVESVKGDVVILVPREALQRRDRRDHPRVAAEIPLEYRVLVGAESQGERRTAVVERAHLVAAGTEFSRPDPFVDVSGTGIRFIDPSPPQPSDLLLVRMQFDPHGPWLGAIAEVVRIEEEVPGEWSVATTFVELGPSTFDALLDFIARRQEALLGMQPERSGDATSD